MNTLIEVYRNYLSANKYNDTNPLVFLFIDDADLKPEIINELLFVIPKYLSHPNVVVFISGSQKTLALAVKTHMYRAITHKAYDLMELMDIEYKYNSRSYKNEEIKHIKFSNLRYGKEYVRIEKLSDEILRKLFPVYNKFYIKTYIDYSSKASFQVFKEERPDCKDSIRFSEKISELLVDFYNKTMDIHRKKMKTIKINGINEPSVITLKKKIENIKLLSNKREIGLSFDNYFYLFFGQYARDISAVYLSLKEMISGLLNLQIRLYEGEFGMLDNAIPQRCIELTHEVVMKFLESAIISNRRLKMFSNHITEMVKTQLLHWQLYIDYSKVLEIFKQPEYYENNLNDPNPFMEMLCLLNFVEELIVLIMPQRRKSHGLNEVVEFINSAGIDIIQKTSRIDDLFKQYYTFSSFNIISHFDINRVEHQYNFINAIDNLSLYKKIYKNNLINQRWIQLLSQVFYKRYSPFSRLNDYKEELLIFKEYLFVDSKYVQLKESYYSYLKERMTISFMDYKKHDRIEKEYEDNKDIDRIVYFEANQCIIELNNCIRNALICSSFTEEFESHINYIDVFENKNVKKESIELYRMLNKKNTYRYELIKQLNKIKAIIDSDEDEYVELHIWYDSLEKNINKRIQENYRIVDNRYNECIKKLNSIYKIYIDYYIGLILSGIITENKSLPIKIYDNSIIGLIDANYRHLEKMEWNSIVGE